MTSRVELIERLKQIDIIYPEEVELKHAGISNFYVDVKKAYGYPDVMKLIYSAVWEQMDKRTTCIAAAGYGGIPLGKDLSSTYNLHLSMVRDEEKKHGKKGWIDGYVPREEDKISIVDDVFTTGGSLKKIIEIVKQTKAQILSCHVVVKRGEGNLEVPLFYLLTPEDLL